MKIKAIKNIRENYPSKVFLAVGETASITGSPTNGSLDTIEPNHLYTIVKDSDGDRCVKQGDWFAHKVRVFYDKKCSPII